MHLRVHLCGGSEGTLGCQGKRPNGGASELRWGEEVEAEGSGHKGPRGHRLGGERAARVRAGAECWLRASRLGQKNLPPAGV